MTESTEIVNPLVFQCINCKSIIGDSFGWLNANEELNAITLTSKATIVHLDESLQFSSHGPDKGSAFMSLKCGACLKILGKSYKTTPRKWDILREMYTFELDSISTYQLGVDSPVDHDAEIFESMPSCLELQTMLEKLQAAVLHLNSKVEKLEASCDTNNNNNNNILNEELHETPLNGKRHSNMANSTTQSQKKVKRRVDNADI